MGEKVAVREYGREAAKAANKTLRWLGRMVFWTMGIILASWGGWIIWSAGSINDSRMVMTLAVGAGIGLWVSRLKS